MKRYLLSIILILFTYSCLAQAVGVVNQGNPNQLINQTGGMRFAKFIGVPFLDSIPQNWKYAGYNSDFWRRKSDSALMYFDPISGLSKQLTVNVDSGDYVKVSDSLVLYVTPTQLKDSLENISGIDTLYLYSVLDSFVNKNDSTILYVTPSQLSDSLLNIPLYAGYGLIKTDTIFRVDTSVIATVHDVTNVPTIFNSNGALNSSRTVTGNGNNLIFTGNSILSLSGDEITLQSVDGTISLNASDQTNIFGGTAVAIISGTNNLTINNTQTGLIPGAEFNSRISIDAALNGNEATTLQQVSDTANTRLRVSDTSGMLNAYLRKVDTFSLSNRINLKANDNAVVHLAGAESISGLKNFTISPTVPYPSGGPTQAANAEYVDDKVTYIENNYIPNSAMGVANGVATLGPDGKIYASQIPSLATSETFVVGSQAEMLSLVAERGDIAVDTSVNKSFILADTPTTVLANWVELRSPTVVNSDQVPEGSTNLYFTTQRARQSITTTGDINYNPITGVLSGVNTFNGQLPIWYLNRENHTGTQAQNTVIGLVDSLESHRSDINGKQGLMSGSGYPKFNGTTLTYNATIPFSDVSGYSIPTWAQVLSAGNTTSLSPTITTNPGLAGYTFANPSGTARWRIRTSNVESGSNTGSDFAIQRFNDLGASFGNSFLISRENGNVTIPSLASSGIKMVTASTSGVLGIIDIPVDTPYIAGSGINITGPYPNLTISNTHTGSTSITLSGTSFQRAALTGDVTASANSNTTSISNNVVTDVKLRQSSGWSIIGRSTSTTGNVADITAGTDGYVLRRNGPTLSFGTIGNASISDLAWSKITSTPNFALADSTVWETKYRTDTMRTRINNDLAGKELIISPGTVNQYWRGDKTWQAFPNIPAQFNPIAGAGIGITGTYPNMTFTNTSTLGVAVSGNIFNGFDLSLSSGNTVGIPAMRIINGPANDWALIPRNTVGYMFDGAANSPISGQPFGITAGSYIAFGSTVDYPSGILALTSNPYNNDGDGLFWVKNYDGGTASQSYQVASRQWVLSQGFSTLNGNGYVKMSGTTPSYFSNIPYTDISGTPTIGNGTITLNTSGVLSGSTNFTVNQTGNTTFTIMAPSFGTTAGTVAEGNHTHSQYELLANKVSTLNSPNNTTYPTTQAVSTAISDIASSGSYTPTLTPSGSGTFTPNGFTSIRVGNVIHVSGRISCSSVTAGPQTIRISLPVPSDLTNAYDATGPVSGLGLSDANNYVNADVTNNEALLNVITTGTSATAYISFQYIVQ